MELDLQGGGATAGPIKIYVDLRRRAARDNRERSRPHLPLEEPTPCAICGSSSDHVSQHHLTHGVAIWLCRTHRERQYLDRAGGRVFVEHLLRCWRSQGTASRRRLAALRSHLHQVQAAAGRLPLPGSYAWPELRVEAERRFAAGEDPGTVIGELRRSLESRSQRAPSYRTMRRWFQDGRWRRGAAGRRARRRNVHVRRVVRVKPLGGMLMPWSLMKYHPASRVILHEDGQFFVRSPLDPNR